MKKIKLDQFYSAKDGDLILVPCFDVDTDNLRKLSVYEKIKGDVSSEILDSRFAKIVDFQTDNFIFKKSINEDLSIWQVYIDEGQMSGWLETLLKPSLFDYLLWPKGCIKAPKLMVFDMDSTFIQIEVIDELARRHGVGEQVSKVTESAMRGELDFSESLISRVACLEGLSEATIFDIANQLPLSKGVDILVKTSANRGVKTAIVSGGFMPFVNYLKNEMDLYQVKANNLQVANGLLTGKVLGDIVDAKSKAEFVNKLIAEMNLSKDDVITIGDGANDLMMMKESGFSLAYRAKPAVQAEANGRMNKAHLNHLCALFEW